jgi:16S rRNA A1518/A1519 N6-dimethyltransferase RsmA/KsgA/DIM1 with predicted DNA glycosylase/AP lyase activity
MILESLNISPNIRPENLSIMNFCKLAKKIYEN